MRQFGSLLLVVAMGLFCAPGAATYQNIPEIRGVLVELGTSQPIAGGEITLEFYGPAQPRVMPSPAKSSATTRTDASGHFAFQPREFGYFYIRAKKDGYAAIGEMPQAPSSQQSVTLSAAQPVRQVRLLLCRPGRIVGLIVDDETRKPMPKVQVQAVSMRGRRLIPTWKTAHSRADGQFSVSDLSPGEYLIQIMPQIASANRVLSTFSDHDTKAVDRDLEETYWPGGHGPDMGVPVTLLPGATMGIGVLPVMKTTYHRVHVQFSGLNCLPGEAMGVTQFQRARTSDHHVRLSQVRCRQDLLVTGFAPGAYRLLFHLRRAQEQDEIASIPFVITDRNLDIAAPLERPVSIEGTFLAAEGGKLPDLSSVTVSWEYGGGKPNDLSGPAKPDAKGKFHLPTFLSEGRRLIINHLGAGGYVKEIRYNGSPVKGDFVPLDKYSLTQSLIIVLDDKPGAIWGEVVEDHKPVSQAIVILAKWPLPDPEMPLFGDLARAWSDEKGRFRLGGLAPGEYRIAAFTAQILSDSSYERIHRVLAESAKIEVGVNSLTNVKLDVNRVTSAIP